MNIQIQIKNQKNKQKPKINAVIVIFILLIFSGSIIFKLNSFKPEQKLNVPIENQLPDLPNGCEVTSLSMLLKYYGINVTKDQLAHNIQYVPSYTANGNRGNPNHGFVGYMSLPNAGWCVYNHPLYDIAQKYTNRIQNATGTNFDQLIQLVSQGHPVMVITTIHFKPVNDMQTWQTDQGIVHVTPSSHAAVITGYNKNKHLVYVNDPNGGIKNRPLAWKNFKKSYQQQGKQALYVK